MPAGDATRTWFPELEAVLKSQWSGVMAWEDVIALCQLLTEERLGNALSAMCKRGAVSSEEVLAVWEAAQAIPVELREPNLPAALRLAVQFGIYAYDAYFLECALNWRLPLLTFDRGMKHVAQRLCVPLME
jgi:predicted nucleic acid-binding protein